jgi:hypothetical protein
MLNRTKLSSLSLNFFGIFSILKLVPNFFDKGVFNISNLPFYLDNTFLLLLFVCVA